jgi:hypothetical protein
VNGVVLCRYTLAPDLAAAFVALIDSAFEKACAVFEHMHNCLGDMEEKADSVIIARGCLPESMKAKLAYKADQCVPRHASEVCAFAFMMLGMHCATIICNLNSQGVRKNTTASVPGRSYTCKVYLLQVALHFAASFSVTCKLKEEQVKL